MGHAGRRTQPPPRSLSPAASTTPPPLDNYRSYPVYHPAREPKGYWDALRRKRPEPLIKPVRLLTKSEWIQEGARIWQEWDVAAFRVYAPETIALIRSAAEVDKSGTFVQPDGTLFAFRWVVTPKGLALSVQECGSCHGHHMPDGAPLPGAGFNRPISGPFFQRLVEAGDKTFFPGDSLPQLFYRAYGVPWLTNDIHARVSKMPPEVIGQYFAAEVPGVVDRFNGSPIYVTKVVDLIGVAERRYLDHTATHRHRGIGDIMRYAALVGYADSMDFGPHRMLNARQRRVRYRAPDDALYALAEYIYSLKPPPNPNRFDDLAARGKRVFESAQCGKCHMPPAYTNNKLTLADGFQVPAGHPYRDDILPLSVGTDPGLALKTRKGTGLYRVPSLKGVWYRSYFGHDGGVASLEEWFDPARLKESHVPGGFKGHGVKTRAIPGHEFGLHLPAAERKALIAFLRTL